RMLRDWRQRGATAVAMEISSHALALDRTYGLAFDVGVFTNLTQDHLDFHGTLDAYRDAKVRLFRSETRGDRTKRFTGAVNVDEGQPFQVLVDYAHTPDALERALEAVRAFRPRRIHCVFGCGGDRDKGKRPLMGKVAARLADQVILTSDNPRSEDPESILRDI